MTNNLETSLSRKVDEFKEIRIAGMKPSIFAIAAIIILSGLYFEVIPDNMVSGFAVAMVIGGLLSWIGKHIPGLSLVGGPAILCIFIPGLMVHLGIFPENGVKIVSNFYQGYGFVDFLIAALISGSLLSMDRKILIKAGTRFFIPVSAGIVFTVLIGGFIGKITGFGFERAILFVVSPIMGGGIGAGAIPMSQMFAAYAGKQSSEFMSMIVPAIMVANIFCIITAAALNGMSKQKKQPFKGFSGNGAILRRNDITMDQQTAKKTSAYFSNLAIGIIVSGALYILGYIIMKKFIPNVHAYAWTILAAALIKILNLAPKEIEEAAGDWYEFVADSWIPTVLVGLSLSLIDINQIIQVVTNPAYLAITVLTVVVACVSAGFFGLLVYMNFVEAAITAGLCMADAGGAGDVAVLGASERMNLMPFAQISSRLGGALILVVLSFLIPILM